MEPTAITGISHEGKGVGRLADGKVVFVPGALPDERVFLGTVTARKNHRSAEVVKFAETNPLRRIPPCPVAGICGGCALQHAEENLQATLKERILQDALWRIGRLERPVAPILSMDHPWRYRNKGIFHVAYQGGTTQLGFFAKGSHTLIHASDCLLFSEQVNNLARWLEEAITQTGIPHHISKVMIRESHATGDLMLVLATSTPDFRLDGLVESLLGNWPEIKSLWHNVNTQKKTLLGRTYHHLFGAKTIEDQIGENCYQLSPQSFFQVNTKQTQVLYDTVAQHTPLQPEDTLLDLYCGIGTIGLHLSDQVQYLIGVESIAQAVKDAKANATYNGIKNAAFYNEKVEKWLPGWMAKGNSAQALIIDPPRKGCDPRLLDAILESQTPNLTYVSCNPATLARDLRVLVDGGYEVRMLQPVDMFPQTAHVEVIALMSRVDE